MAIDFGDSHAVVLIDSWTKQLTESIIEHCGQMSTTFG